jgi:sugar O-acyltransferase (sialic acid O-acetyltransferase NeuD family)
VPPVPEEGTRLDHPGDPWLLIGGGGHAVSVAAVLRRAGGTVTAVVDPAPRRSWPCPVYPSEAAAAQDGRTARAVVALGENRPRLDVQRRCLELGLTLGVVVAATATVDAADIGPGSVVLEHGHVGPGSTVGAAVIINTGAVVEHDCVVEDGVHVAPGAYLLGECVVGAGALVGARAVVLPGRTVGSGARVGAGAVVTEDVPPGATVVGVPAARRP